MNKLSTIFILGTFLLTACDSDEVKHAKECAKKRAEMDYKQEKIAPGKEYTQQELKDFIAFKLEVKKFCAEAPN